MRKRSLILVIAIYIAVPALVYFYGSSKFTVFPKVDEIAIHEQRKNELSFPLTGMLDGMHQFRVHLPPVIKRRPIHLVLETDDGTEAARLEVDPDTARRSHRNIFFDHPIAKSMDKRYTVRFVFEDGPVLSNGKPREEVFYGLALTAYYDLSLSKVKSKYCSFKPLSTPLLFSFLVFTLYMVVTAFLLSTLRRSG